MNPFDVHTIEYVFYKMLPERYKPFSNVYVQQNKTIIVVRKRKKKNEK